MNTAPTCGFDDVVLNDSSFLFEIRKTPPAELKDFTVKRITICCLLFALDAGRILRNDDSNSVQGNAT